MRFAHIAQRHAADQMTKVLLTKWSLSALGAMLGNAGGAGGAQAAGAVMANGVFLKFSRDDEREADRVGLAIMTKAGWDARGMTELFETLRREQQRDPSSVEVFFSTHPSPLRSRRRRDGAGGPPSPLCGFDAAGDSRHGGVPLGPRACAEAAAAAQDEIGSTDALDRARRLLHRI